MRFPIIVIAVFIIIDLFVDGYIYMAIKRRAPYSRRRRLLKFQTIESLIFLCVLISLIFMPVRTTSDTLLRVVMWLLYGYLTVYVPKIFWIIIDLIASIPKLSNRPRIGWLSGVGSIGAGIIFIMMWWGALVNRFNIQVREIEIPVKNLPSAFDGFKIAQFSDLHTGTFGKQTKFVSKLVDEINELNPDLIVFTGDIVNRNSNELIPFVSILSRLHAPYGVVSVMGNHDYGDYTTWASDIEKQANLKTLHRLEKKMGWDLLLNQSKNIYRGNDSILIIGVENIGDPPFRVYGSLEKACDDTSTSQAKILLSHNPAHWTSDIADNPAHKIDLTLSGHTHAMQVELLGMSPAVFRYPTWAGLYHDKTTSNRLYVNIGAGTVGLPMRIGATPEITLITLRREY